MKRIIPLIGLILFLGCVNQFESIAHYKEEVPEVFENNVDAGEISLDFQTFNGFTEIHLWDKKSYRIEVNKWARATTSEEAERKAQDLQVDLSEERTEGKLTLTLKVESIKNTGAEIKAFLPRTTFDAIYLSTANSYILVEEIYAKDVFLNTTNGYCEAYITASTIRVNTTNGFVKGFYDGNEVTIETSNGKIEIACGDAGTYVVGTTNGFINVSGGSSGSYTISTTNGSINVTLTGDFVFDLETTMGVITVDADTITYTLDEKNHMKGYTREGALLTVTASTTNGTVTVTKE